MRTFLPLCCLATLVSTAPARAAGQDSAGGAPQIPALFSSHELIEFTIETDYGALRGDRKSPADVQPSG